MKNNNQMEKEKLYIVSYYQNKVVGIKGVPETVSKADIEEVYSNINQMNKQETQDHGTKTCNFKIIEVKDPEIQAMLDFMIYKISYIEKALLQIREAFNDFYSFDSDFYKTILTK